jgi:MSHA biogenesis protein MshP
MTIPRTEPYRILPRSAGVGLVTAIFLLVVMAGLAVAMVGISSAQHTASALDIQGARAYQAARAGIEWGLFKNMRPPGQCLPSASFQLPATSTLKEFAVTVTCVKIAALPGEDPSLARFEITATACNQPAAGACPNASNSPDYVERQLVVTI